MKTIKYFLTLLVINILLTGCPDITPTEQIEISINNVTSDTLNLYYADNSSKYYSNNWVATLYSLPSSTNLFLGLSFNDNNIRKAVFETVVKNKLTDKRLVVVDISGDTLAKWDDSSIVFNDQQYWTITTSGSKYMYFDCTLNLTDEVLKLK